MTFVVEMAEMASFTLRLSLPSCALRAASSPSSSGFKGDVGLIWSDSANSVFAQEREFLRTLRRTDGERGRKRRRAPFASDDINH